jgi:putative colanic acid biosynthesis acetyltransferase WcaF
MSVDLSTFSNPTFSHGKSIVVRMLWMLVSRLFFNTWVPYPSTFKAIILRVFGAKVGKGLVIRTHVRIKQPWRLSIGDHVWIGESVWIDNLVQVAIASNACLSQGAFLLTGNHDYKSTSFDLITGEIHLESGVWIGAKALVGPGVRCMSHSVLAAGSITFKDLEANKIYQGNPAEVKRERKI